MACRNAYRANIMNMTEEKDLSVATEANEVQNVDRLLFGVDSEIQSSDLLQKILRSSADKKFWEIVKTLFSKRVLTGGWGSAPC